MKDITEKETETVIENIKKMCCNNLKPKAIIISKKDSKILTKWIWDMSDWDNFDLDTNKFVGYFMEVSIYREGESESKDE
jgi:hypothetical protein